MQKQLIVTVLCGTLLLAGTAVLAEQGGMPNARFEGPQQGRTMCARGEAPQEHDMRMLECLDLSAAQRKEVKKLRDESFKLAEKWHEKMAEVRRKLRRASAPKTFDEKQLRTLVAEKSRIEADLMVDRAGTRARIYALLTPEQQELADLADKLRQLQGHGPGAPGRPVPLGMMNPGADGKR
ncbi:CpxP superfamily protein [Syntrophotalea carbinolica DSM 2380]|uniref:CpxP superfamily protein n=1 Tax=Syntrophotalea carbinolica (strain DSM 2380 / NBRC 103641 / GraBd1) TaxID=338963 RepID=Q3A7M1_SYNC1|nr:Spy/CpxP family protein refolding chaperone [Syntrophotalea carbinolica]ABA87623.1 CpxP superfamily protein [Syntrophotalea carbinolica DSM 2380]